MNESSPFFLTNFTENTACLPEGRVFTSYSRSARFRRMVDGIYQRLVYKAKVQVKEMRGKDRKRSQFKISKINMVPAL
jgi:hypothetical protein